MQEPNNTDMLQAGIQMAMTLSENWGLTPFQRASLLEAKPEDLPAFNRVIEGFEATPEQLALLPRLSLLLQLQAYIEQYEPRQQWNSFVHTSHPASGGKPPIEVLCGEDIDAIASMLNSLYASCNGNFS